jgi:membrane-associated phospholipid phosphatase
MTMHSLARSITEFGNSGLLLFLSVLIAVWLGVTQRRRDLTAWLLVLATGIGLLVLSKLYFSACPWTDAGLRSPSGHAGFSALVYGGMVYCATARERRWTDWALRLAAAGLIGLIAWSRVALHAHSTLEVVVGTSIGLIALALFVGVSRPRPASLRQLAIALTAILLLWWWAHGVPLQIEPLLARWGRWLGAHVLSCGGS